MEANKRFDLSREIIVVLLIFLIGFALRFWSIWPYNTILGFDQARDLWDATTIFRDGNLRIIGPTAGNNPNLHHGILYIYYLIPPLILGGGNPAIAALWNSIFNAGAGVALYFFAKSLFNSPKAGLIAGLLVAFSYQFVQFSGWLSNPTVTLFTVPVFFFALWKYYQNKNWGMPLAFLFLGLSIQFELFFIYLIPIGIVLWLILRPPMPSKKLLFLSLTLLALSLSTMIATEIKFGFGGIKSILSAGSFVGGEGPGVLLLLPKFLQRFETFSLNLTPSWPKVGEFFGAAVVIFLVFEFFRSKDKQVKKRNIFLAIYYFSPLTMLFLGFHNAPWFLIGRPGSVILIAVYVLYRIKSKILLYAILALVIFSNLMVLVESHKLGQILLEPDKSALMDWQIKAVDYTYRQSHGEKFSINTLTNPLYINALWSYHYKWYGEKTYQYLPSWEGGDQLYPYDVLPKASGGEKYLYLLMDDTPRIPVVHKLEIRKWADKESRLIETRSFGQITVEKRLSF